MSPKKMITRFIGILLIAQIVACDNVQSKAGPDIANELVKDSFESQGVRINYVTKGKGEPVILIHGFLGNANYNWMEPGIFDTLAKEYQVIAIDVRGHGASGKPHEEAAYGTVILEDLNGIMKRFNIDRANIVGYSMGGEIVLAYTATYPEKVIKAVAGGCGWVKAGDEKSGQWKQIGEQLATKPAGVTILEQLWGIKDTASAMTKAFNANDALALAGVAKGMQQLSIEEEKIKANKVPTLLLVGEEDPLKASAQATVAAVPNMTLQEIKGRDHLNVINDPLFVAAIKNYLSNKHN